MKPTKCPMHNNIPSVKIRIGRYEAKTYIFDICYLFFASAVLIWSNFIVTVIALIRHSILAQSTARSGPEYDLKRFGVMTINMII